MYTYKARFQVFIARYSATYTCVLFNTLGSCLCSIEFLANCFLEFRKSIFVYVRKYVWRAMSVSRNQGPWIFEFKKSMTCDVRGALFTYRDGTTSVNLAQWSVECFESAFRSWKWTLDQSEYLKYSSNLTK